LMEKPRRWNGHKKDTIAETIVWSVLYL
jgi:hypothetical protein